MGPAHPVLDPHGDGGLHPGNLVSREGALAGSIDFGDVTAGDPAYDLAVAYGSHSTRPSRARFHRRGGRALRRRDGVATRAREGGSRRAHVHSASSEDNPDYFALGTWIPRPGSSPTAGDDGARAAGCAIQLRRRHRLRSQHTSRPR